VEHSGKIRGDVSQSHQFLRLSGECFGHSGSGAMVLTGNLETDSPEIEIQQKCA
jgi:hypothetical protein